ncbi:unnamed protein product [Didymodactylos carnosus]|uniref:RNA ligase domain-containing protein n=1 Tax=Didymodactylos carnosus TaxID=1234261 RepID=A0A814WS33_9BILA|nr:unnamed protein product [Didymodactylos carnosus]CAF3969142.1 unnamed protein product [Didymodactylos carnosus]
MMIAYPETEQFRSVIEKITRNPSRYKIEHGKSFPVLKFIGTVKLHGTNAAIVYQKDFEHYCQSRNNIITPEMDNAGFARFMYSLAKRFLMEKVLPDCPVFRKHFECGNNIVIYGEWCGGNIQKNVAIQGLARMFVIFKIRVGNSKAPLWLDPKEWSNLRWPEQSIFNIHDFPTYEIPIDFNQPKLSQNKLTEITEAVEQECPVGAHFNRNGAGEGVVWTEWTQSRGLLTFKVKGKEHSVRKVSQLASVETEKFTSLFEFVEYACTENRMQQAVDYLYEQQLTIEMENVETFLRWLTADIIKEESDTMNDSNINSKDVGCAITDKATAWFQDQLYLYVEQ